MRVVDGAGDDVPQEGNNGSVEGNEGPSGDDEESDWGRRLWGGRDDEESAEEGKEKVDEQKDSPAAAGEAESKHADEQVPANANAGRGIGHQGPAPQERGLGRGPFSGEVGSRPPSDIRPWYERTGDTGFSRLHRMYNPAAAPSVPLQPPPPPPPPPTYQAQPSRGSRPRSDVVDSVSPYSSYTRRGIGRAPPNAPTGPAAERRGQAPPGAPTGPAANRARQAPPSAPSRYQGRPQGIEKKKPFAKGSMRAPPKAIDGQKHTSNAQKAKVKDSYARQMQPQTRREMAKALRAATHNKKVAAQKMAKMQEELDKKVGEDGEKREDEDEDEGEEEMEDA